MDSIDSGISIFAARQDIRLVPSVVSGEPSDRRSIVAAKSIPCKLFGINTAEPVSMAPAASQPPWWGYVAYTVFQPLDTLP